MRTIRYFEAMREAIREEMERDSNVILMGEDVGIPGGLFTQTKGLYKQFGEERVKDTPASEAGFLGLAIGAATMGLRPVVEISFMDFMMVCMDQLANTAPNMIYSYLGKIKLPLVVCTYAGAGLRGGWHHSKSFENWFVNIPGLKVVMPSTAYDLMGLLKSSIRDNNPVIFIQHKALLRLKNEVPDDEYLIPLGKADIKREGSDVTIVALSQMVHKALAAAEKLQKENISAEVIDPMTLSPLDKNAIIQSVRKTGRLVTVHEAQKPCGFGAEIASIIYEEAFEYLTAPLRRICPPFTPIPANPILEDTYLPSEENIIEAVREVVNF